MRNILNVKFEKFIEDFNLQDGSKDANWKRFVNYHFFSQFQPGRLDTDADLLDQICVEVSWYSQIHGVLFLLNDQILSEVQDIDDILQRDQKGLLELYFLTHGNMDRFVEQLERLFHTLDVIEKKEGWLKLLAYAMSKETVLRWKDNPVLKIVSYQNMDKKGKLGFSDRFSQSFSNIDYIRIDEKRLQKIINSNENSYQAEVECKSALLIPSEGKKLGNAYILCMSAQELIKLMTTSDGLLRRNMFEDNVRDSQGFSTVNQEILSTLKTYPERFVLFNNGITIVCRSVKIENGRYVLENPQIVNGCQTCNMIYQAYSGGMDFEGVQIIAKIIGTDMVDVTQGIVRGANRQNIVYEEAFETIREFHKNIEKYFEINQVNGYQKIYYERRSKQYAAFSQIKPYQKISFRGLIQSMVALFLNHVEDSHKHEYTLLKDYKDILFVDTHSCQPYYLAAFFYLNVDVLFRSKKLPKELSSYKMHIMLLIKEMKGGVSPDLSSDDIDQYCERLLKVLENSRLEQYALEACRKFEKIRAKWIALKGEQYKYGIKDSADFRGFLIKEIHGISEHHDAEKLYTGYVMNIDLDKHNTLFGFIEHTPNNIFFHEFDNPAIDRSYIGKRVCYKIVRSDGQERAVNVRLI